MAGLDLFIGEETYLNKGYGSKVIAHFLREIVFQKYKAAVIDPDRENKRALKAYQKAGFKNFSVEKSSEYNETIQLMIIKKECYGKI